MSSRIARLFLGLALVGLVAACAPASSTTLGVPGTAPVLLGAHNDTSTPFNLVSVPALTAHRYDGRGLRITDTLAKGPAFTRYAVAYRSGRLTVTGVMNVPNRSGRHPVVVIAHGHGDPARYTSGSMLEREQAALAEHGFVAFQIDYRNYARSTRESTTPVARPLGYPADLVNAVVAFKRTHLPFADTTRIGLFGRSMGGGVVLNALVARPHLAQAAVLYSPVSSLASDNYRRWVVPNDSLRQRVEDAYGTPTSNPGFWDLASSRGYLDRVAVPIQIDHGTSDPVCPFRWSKATTRALQAAGKDVTLYEYPGEDHRFDRSWATFMHRAVVFLRAQLT
ncbi:MAG: alpha/beta fold hydrolase [Nocardioidaceae bacterium]